MFYGSCWGWEWASCWKWPWRYRRAETVKRKRTFISQLNDNQSMSFSSYYLLMTAHLQEISLVCVANRTLVDLTTKCMERKLALLKWKLCGECFLKDSTLQFDAAKSSGMAFNTCDRFLCDGGSGAQAARVSDAAWHLWSKVSCSIDVVSVQRVAVE